MQGIQIGGVMVTVQTEQGQTIQALALLRKGGGEGVKVCQQVAGLMQWMGRVQPAQDQPTQWVRWIARGLGLLLILLTLVPLLGGGVIGGGMPTLLAVDLCAGCLSLALITASLGIAVAWRWETIGAILIISSTLLFEGIHAIAGGSWRFTPLDSLFYLVGLLFLWVWWRTSTLPKRTAVAADTA